MDARASYPPAVDVFASIRQVALRKDRKNAEAYGNEAIEPGVGVVDRRAGILSLVKTRAALKSRTYALLVLLEFRGEEGQTPPPCSAYSSFSSLSAPVRCGRCVGAEPTL